MTLDDRGGFCWLPETLWGDWIYTGSGGFVHLEPVL